MITSKDCLNLRQQELTRIPLAKPQVPLTESARDKMISEQLELFRAMVPFSNKLRASMLSTAIQAEPDGLMMIAMLVEIPQIALPVSIKVNRRDMDGDPYSLELGRIQSEQACAGYLVRLASSPATMPSSPEVIEIRRLLRKYSRQGFLDLPTSGLATRVAIDSTPAVMPRSVTLKATVRVDSISRTQAQIRASKVEEHTEASKTYIVPGKRYILRRTKSHRNMESGSRLHGAMESNTELTVNLRPAIDWANGQVKYLELVEFCM